MIRVALGALVLLAAAPAAARPLVVAAHVHTVWSGGAHTPEEIGRLAAERGVDAVLLADHDLVRAVWGVPPFEHLLAWRVDRPSVLARGPAAYLAEVAAATRATGVLLVPGAEVSAHARWEGLPGDLALRGWRRHLLLYGLADPEAWEDLPVPGNTGRVRWDRLPWGPLVGAGLGLLVSLGLWASARRPGERRWAAGLAAVNLLGLGHLALTPAVPWPVQGPAAVRAGWAPYQAVIDHGRAHGALVVWAHPDAAPADERVGEGLASATLRDEPYPEALVATRGTHGFEALVAGPSPSADPGGPWDAAATRSAAAGEAPPWGFAGQDLHRDGRAGWLGEIVLLVDAAEASWPALREALAAGRFTVARREPHREAHVAWFSPAPDGASVRVRIEGSPGLEAALTLVAAGRPVARARVRVPAEVTLPLPPAPSPQPVRLRLEGPGALRALTNPVLVPAAPPKRS
ncbi:hypothetical protein [Deferrisoma sp.]